MKKGLLLFVFLAFSYWVWGQNSLNSGDFVGGTWGSGQSMASSAGTSLIITKTVTSSGDKYFRFYGDGSPCGEYQPNNNGDSFTSGVKVTTPNGNCGNSNAWKINVPTTDSNVIFKTDGVNDGIDSSIIFVVQGAVRSVTNVSYTNYIVAGDSYTVNATLDGALNTGQGVYLRYTNDNFTTSTVVAMSGSGTAYSATIPGSFNTSGTTVKYYVFTSGNGLTISGSDADFYTINLNGGSNYNYSVLSGAGTCSGTATYVGNDTWSGGITPDATRNVVIDADLTINDSYDMFCCTLTINEGKTLTINTGKSVYITNGLTINGNLIINSGGSLVQLNDSSNTYGANSSVKVIRTSTDYVLDDYTYWSSPIAGETLSSALAASPQNRIYKFDTAVYSDRYNQTASGSTFGFPQTQGTPDNYDDDNNAWVAHTGTMTPGVGYIAKGDLTVAPSANGQTVEFIATGTDGYLNNGNIVVPVSLDLYHTASHSGADTFNLNQNLIGNPYPSAVDMVILTNDNSSVLTGTYYFWTHKTPINSSTTGPYTQNFTNNDYVTYTAGTGGSASSCSGCAVPDQYVDSCQGFFANVKAAGNVTFKNSQRKLGNNTGFYRNNTVEQKNRIWLNFLPTNNDFRQILVGFIEGSSDEYNPYYDGQRMENGVGYDFYSYIPTQPEVRLAVNGMGTFEISKVVPLGLEIVENGTHQITLDHAEGIFTQGQKAYLKDNYTTTIHDLSEGAYSFTQDVTDNLNNRFELIFALPLATDILNADSFAVYPNPSKGVFHINSKFNDAMQVQVTDVTGKLIGTYYFDNATQQTLDISGLQSGIYLAKISVKGNSVTKKLIVE